MFRFSFTFMLIHLFSHIDQARSNSNVSVTTSCDDAYSCESMVIEYQGDDDIECYGYFSCYQALIVTNNSDITCAASYSCYNASYIYGNYIECAGLFSCALTSYISACNNDNCDIACLGEQSCFSSIIHGAQSNTIFCQGDRSCMNSTIYGSSYQV